MGRRPRRPLAAAALAGAALLLGGVPAPAAAAWAAGGSLGGPGGGGRIWSLTVNPAGPLLVLAGTDRGVYRSLDGGQSWSPTPLSAPRVWSVGFDARNTTVAYAGTSGRGIFRSVDGGANWVDVSAGLANRSVRSLAFGLDGIAAGTDDGVAVSADGEHWHGGGPGDQLHGYSISSVAVAANAPQFTVIAGADSGDLVRGYLFRTRADGSWEVLQAGLPANAVVASVSAGVISPSVTHRPLLVTTSKGAFRSGDTGTSWTESAGIPKDPAPVTLTTATFSPLDPNLVYAGADSGGSAGGDLMRSTDGGGSFAPASQGLPDRSRNVAALTVSATSPPQLVAALNSAAGAAVYRETDTTVPTPPGLTAEGTAPIASGPAPPASPLPTVRPGPREPAPAPTPTNPIAGALGAAFHWPVPLILEVPLAAIIGLVVTRWRRHYLDIEGPP